MKIPFRRTLTRLGKAAKLPRQLSGSGPRDLRGDLKKQATEKYWRRRQNPRFRKVRLSYLKPRLEGIMDGARRNIAPVPGIIRSAIFPILIALVAGFIFLGTVLIGEFFLARHVWSAIVPTGEPAAPVGTFPILAVQVAASLLGFYLASVSIVLGNSYHNVSADTRNLVLGSPRTRTYLAAVGIAIGGGLTLVLLQSLEFTYGYLTVATYTLVIIASGWSFIQLAYGAFRLFDPTALSEEPLTGLYRAFGQIESKSLKDDTVALRIASQKANRDLLILSELIGMMSDRVSIDRGRLATIVGHLLLGVRLYAQRKDVLSPTSTWFIRQPTYPKWIETSHSDMSIRLKTSTSLQPQLEPSVDWVEKRSAELASAAIEACVAANDRDSALIITNDVAATAYSLAWCHRIDDAITFSSIVKDRCQGIQESNPAAIAVMSAPPMILTSLLLGWREAILNWPDEIQKAVSETKWDHRSTATVPIRGSQRVWETAQQLLNQVKSEREIEGRRVTPSWYLEVALADACIRSIREIAKELPKQMEEFLIPNPTSSLPEANAMSGLQALQALAKVQLLADTLPEAVRNLDSLMLGNDREQGEEIEIFAEKIAVYRTEVFRRISGAVAQLQPERSKSEPDLFGESFFKLLHHTEEAIATGNVSSMNEIFPQILRATFVLQDYMLSTYQGPTYQANSAILDPTIDILELSGLAMVYAALRTDQSDAPLHEAWSDFLAQSPRGDAASRILNVLDIVDSSRSMGISSRSVIRTEWEMRLSRVIVEHGYAPPTYDPLLFENEFENELRPWNAPPLIKMLGVSERGRSIFLKPRAIFAAEVIGPLSGEPEEDLRNRPSLRHYYKKKDFQEKQERSASTPADDLNLEDEVGYLL